MITGHSIILEDDILYCSNENKFAIFEIVIIIKKLIISINPKHTWRLNDILLEGYRIGKERIVIKHMITKNKKNLFYCINGNFGTGSREALNILEEFYEKVKKYYRTAEILEKASKKPTFNDIIEGIMDNLRDKYENLLEQEEREEILQDIGIYIKNKIIYCWISIQGLPLISQLYDKTLLSNYLPKSYNTPACGNFKRKFSI